MKHIGARRLREMQQRDHNEYVKLRDFFASCKFFPSFFFLKNIAILSGWETFHFSWHSRKKDGEIKKKKEKRGRNKRKRTDVIKRGNEN